MNYDDPNDVVAEAVATLGCMALGTLVVTARPILLDLFCGAGGCAKGYQQAGFYVVGVDIRSQPRYCGDEFIMGDALEYLRTADLSRYAAIHASPPCQAYTTLKTMHNAREHPDLVGPVRGMLQESGKPYVIENVPGAPMENYVVLCGSMFGLGCDNAELRRHRLFEVRPPILLTPPCNHGWNEQIIGIYGAKVRNVAREKQHYAQDRQTRGAPIGVVLPNRLGFESMGIDWMSISELSQAIPPAYTRFIGEHLMKVVCDD